MPERTIQLIRQDPGGPWHLAEAGRSSTACGTSSLGETRNSLIGVDPDHVCRDCIGSLFELPAFFPAPTFPRRRLEAWRIKTGTEGHLDAGENVVAASFVQGGGGGEDVWELLVAVDLPPETTG